MAFYRRPEVVLLDISSDQLYILTRLQ
jgi:hypothetical protein